MSTRLARLTVDCILSDCDRPVADAAYVCHGCTERLAETLHWVADNADDIDTIISRQSRTGEHAGRGSAETRLPLNWTAVIDADTIRNTMTTWARDIIESRGIDLPAPSRPPIGPLCRTGIDCHHGSCETIRYRATPGPASLANIARFLTDQLPWMRHRRYADAAWDELSYAASVLRRVLDSPGSRRYLGPCHTGDCIADVYAAPGASYATCECGTVHDVAARRGQLLDIARDRIEPASVIATIVHAWTPFEITSSAVRKWVQRGRLVAVDADALSGRPLYPVRDALALAEQAARLKQHKSTAVAVTPG